MGGTIHPEAVSLVEKVIDDFKGEVKKNSIEGHEHYTYQSRALIAGIAFYVVWHVGDMAQRAKDIRRPQTTAAATVEQLAS